MTIADEQKAVAAVERLAASGVAVLDTSVASTILYGSLTLDDFQPGRSDLDLLVVVDRNLAAREVDALVAVVREADLGPAGGIDLVVVTRESAAAPAECPCQELHVGRYPGTAVGLEVERRDDDVPDLLPELSMARADGRALDGAEPHEIIGEVPITAVQDRGLHWLHVWLDLTDDEQNACHMVLTACRIWRFAAEGRHCSKSSAARWALARDPSLTAVAQALSQRMGAASKSFNPDDIRRVLVTVLQSVEGLQPGREAPR
jgi:predicted nucleotidyltransferase